MPSDRNLEVGEMNSQSEKRLVEARPNSFVTMPSNDRASMTSTELPSLTLERRIDGQLWATHLDKQQPVWVSRCFPWSEPGRFISLRDADDEEFALVRDFGELDRRSREALEVGLAEAGFVLEIAAVESCEEEVEIRTWVVVTRQGRRSFQTRRDEWPRDVPGGGLLISDVSGDLFYVPDIQALDAKSLALLWAFVD
jgi:hypothetical protein